MFQRIHFLFAVIILILPGCKPKPIDIAIPQQPETITISSVALNDHTIAVAAGYSVNSLANLEDSLQNENRQSIPKGMLLDSAIVTISENGQIPYTLTQVSTGVYGSRDIKLREGVQYTLSVIDQKKNIAVTSSTCFVPKPQLDKVYPELIRNSSDTITKLHVHLKDVKAGEHYFMFYNTARNTRAYFMGSDMSMASLQAFEPKHLELFTPGTGGQIEKVFTLSVKPDDTLNVTIGRIDDSYYKYLEAYKRTGYLINQITGEPINLPTNINNGFGCFSLYVPERRLFNLRDY